MFLMTLSGDPLTVKTKAHSPPETSAAEGGGIKPDTSITQSSEGPNPEKLAVLTRLKPGDVVAWVSLPMLCAVQGVFC